MSMNFKYWDDCVDPEDMQAMWMDSEVSKEWIDVGESMGQKVHLSRDPDGQPYLTQVEMRAVAEIVVQRHFKSQLDPDMIYAIAEIGSGRQLLAENYDKKTKGNKIGIMQIEPQTTEWLAREIGYRNYRIEENPLLLFRPFVNAYFGGAYIQWLFTHDGKERTEEYVVRAYRGGIKKATRKSTAEYFKQYISIKQSLMPRASRSELHGPSEGSLESETDLPDSLKANSGDGWVYWDSRVSPEDMGTLWAHPDILREWAKSGERRGKVRFSVDSEKRPYLSRVEVKVVAEIIITRYFSSKGVKPSVLAAIAEICSMRFVNGARSRTGLMGIDYPTAAWLYNDIGWKAYKINSVDELYNPFASMYFGAAYLSWLSEFEGRERSHEFIVQAYMAGPENVNLHETGHYWNQFKEALVLYEGRRRDRQGSCSIL